MECFDLQNMTMANRALAQASRHTSTELDRIDDAQLAWKLMTERNWNDVDEFASDCDVCIRRLGRITPWNSAASLTSARSHKQSTYSSSAGCSDAGANITVRRKLQMSRPCCVTQASSSSLSNP